MFVFRQPVIDAYKFLAKDENSVLAWRILTDLLPHDESKAIIETDVQGTGTIEANLSEDFKTKHKKNASVFKKIIGGTPSTVKAIADSSIEKLKSEIVHEEKPSRDLLTSQLLYANQNLPRPLGNLDITVCSILGSKGLGADVVFLIGFDQGKLPAKASAKESEIYQLLVALTRAKKRVYLINTINSKTSSFLDAIDKKFYENI